MRLCLHGGIVFPRHKHKQLLRWSQTLTIQTTHSSTLKALKAVKDAGIVVKGCSHITGGGFYENIPRMLPDGIRAVVEKDSYEVPAIFGLLAKTGNIEEKMMYNTFNMGLGMVIAVDPADKEKVLSVLSDAGEKAWVVGKTIAGEKGVDLC